MSQKISVYFFLLKEYHTFRRVAKGTRYIHMKRIQPYICLAFLINGVMALMTGTLLSYFIDSGLSYTQAGFLTSIQSAGNLMMGLLSGFLIHKLGRKYASVFYCLCFALGFSCILFGNSIFVLYPLIFISGLGWGLCNNVCHLLASDKPGHTVLLHTSYAVGAAIAPLLAQLTLRLHLSWRTCAWIVILPSLLLGILFLFQDFGENQTLNQKAETLEKKSIYFSFFGAKRFYVCFFLYFFYNGVEACINSWLITYLAGLLSLETAQTMLSLLWVFIIFFRLISIVLVKVWKRQILLLTQLFLFALCIILLTFTTSATPAILLTACVGIFMGGITPVIAINCQEFIQGEGFASGILFSGGGLGATVLPAIVGGLTDLFTIQEGMYFVSVACVMLVIMGMGNWMLLKAQRK